MTYSAILIFIVFLTCIIIGGVIGYKRVHNTGKDPIINTKIVDHDNRKSATSSATRGVVGGALLGGVGALAGIASAKNKKSTTFMVEY